MHSNAAGAQSRDVLAATIGAAASRAAAAARSASARAAAFSRSAARRASREAASVSPAGNAPGDPAFRSGISPPPSTAPGVNAPDSAEAILVRSPAVLKDLKDPSTPKAASDAAAPGGGSSKSGFSKNALLFRGVSPSARARSSASSGLRRAAMSAIARVRVRAAHAAASPAFRASSRRDVRSRHA